MPNSEIISHWNPEVFIYSIIGSTRSRYINMGAQYPCGCASGPVYEKAQKRRASLTDVIFTVTDIIASHWRKYRRVNPQEEVFNLSRVHGSYHQGSRAREIGDELAQEEQRYDGCRAITNDEDRPIKPKRLGSRRTFDKPEKQVGRRSLR